MTYDLNFSLKTLARHPASDLSHFHLVKSAQGSRIVHNSTIRQCFSYPWRQERQEQIAQAIEQISAELIHQLDPAVEINPHLLSNVHRFNQVIQSTPVSPLTPIAFPEDHPFFQEMTPVSSVEYTTLPQEGPFTQPQEERKYVPAWGSFFKMSRVQRHAEDYDEEGHPVNHDREAFHIFVSTQWERFLSLIGRICEAIGRLFGIEVSYFQRFHYQQGGEDVVVHQAPVAAWTPSQEDPPFPSSHWLGHATLFLHVPIASEENAEDLCSFNILTDPVEGDLNPILYPRQTPFATPLNELPSTHVMLLSHGHLDHFDAPSIKKLLKQQPVMVVPTQDAPWFRKQGFLHIKELNWWETVEIKFTKNERQYPLRITGIPARHWTGRGPLGGHESGFLGYLIQGNPEGDILFSGDTARISLEELEHLRTIAPNLRWIFEPGGPDEERRDMETTHQASVDALWKHIELLLKPLQAEPNLEAFREQALERKTLFMHTMTFKLGKLHLNDTKESVERVLQALEGEEIVLAPHEQKVLEELHAFCRDCAFGLPSADLATILRETVLIPKIGSTLNLGQPKQDLALSLFDEFILNNH